MIYTFVDTSGWAALLDQEDIRYQAAHELFQNLNRPLITTNFVVSETITLVRHRLSHLVAVNLARDLYSEKFAKLHCVNREIEIAALRLFERCVDKDFSFTDCTSFVVMRNLGITQAFTFDKHFRQMGFQAVP